MWMLIAGSSEERLDENAGHKEVAGQKFIMKRQMICSLAKFLSFR